MGLLDKFVGNEPVKASDEQEKKGLYHVYKVGSLGRLVIVAKLDFIPDEETVRDSFGHGSYFVLDRTVYPPKRVAKYFVPETEAEMVVEHAQKPDEAIIKLEGAINQLNQKIDAITAKAPQTEDVGINSLIKLMVLNQQQTLDAMKAQQQQMTGFNQIMLSSFMGNMQQSNAMTDKFMKLMELAMEMKQPEMPIINEEGEVDWFGRALQVIDKLAPTINAIATKQPIQQQTQAYSQEQVSTPQVQQAAPTLPAMTTSVPQPTYTQNRPPHPQGQIIQAGNKAETAPASSDPIEELIKNTNPSTLQSFVNTNTDIVPMIDAKKITPSELQKLDYMFQTGELTADNIIMRLKASKNPNAPNLLNVLDDPKGRQWLDWTLNNIDTKLFGDYVD